MPFKSKKQKKFMQIVAHNPEIAAQHRIDPQVAKKLVEHDKQAKQNKDSKKK